MIVKKRGLGRGLDALLGGVGAVKDAESGDGVISSGSGLQVPGNILKDLSVDLLQAGKYQPRTEMNADTLEELASSIRAQGVLQPIVVRELRDSPGRYEILAGERRWRAAQLANLHDVPVLLRDVSDGAAIAISLIENIQREDLNPVEEATALERLIDEFDMTHQQAADAVGRSRAAVSNLLRLLLLSPDVRQLLEKGELEMGHARAILSLEGEMQSQVAREIAAKGMSVREAEQLVRGLRSKLTTKKTKKPDIDPNTQGLQDNLAAKLGAKVLFHHGTNGKGKVVIHYNSLDELDGILAHIQ